MLAFADTNISQCFFKNIKFYAQFYLNVFIALKIKGKKKHTNLRKYTLMKTPFFFHFH